MAYTPSKAEWEAIFAEFRTADAAAAVAEVSLGHVPDGTYTVVFNGDENDRITIRCSTVVEPGAEIHGWRKVGFLSGPDNERNFTGFAWIKGDQLQVWKRFRDDPNASRPVAAYLFLARAGDTEKAQAGLTYALQSGNCYRCGRKLTVPASISRGLGPDCAEMVGW